MSVLVGGLGDERVARGVCAHLGEKLVKGDHRSLALGHAHGAAVAQQVDQLAEKDLELRGVAERLAGGLHALDVAVVVGAPDVDHVVDALELVPMVGNVGGEVSVLAVGLDEHAVLVVTKGRGAEPQGTGIVAVEVAHVIEGLERAVDGGGSGLVLHVEAALGEPHVKVAARLVAGLADGVEHPVVPALAELRHALLLARRCSHRRRRCRREPR